MLHVLVEANNILVFNKRKRKTNQRVNCIRKLIHFLSDYTVITSLFAHIDRIKSVTLTY